MWAYIHRANALMRLSQFDIAMSDYEAAIRANPTSADAYYSRGGANAFLGKAQLARSDYRHSAALGNQEALTRLAELEHQISGPEPSREIAGSVSPNVSAAANGRASSLEPQSAAADGNPVQVPTGATSTRPSASVATERRVALVIGNARYQNVDYLDNPGRDADAIAGALRQLGFQSVQVEKDLDLASFAAALRAFEQQADQADWALVYFAGHGIEVNGVNYLVPVDARLRSDRDIPDETITLSRVLERIENARGLRLIILDACRNNPFYRR